jgi:hypothetical protein
MEHEFVSVCDVLVRVLSITFGLDTPRRLDPMGMCV